MTNVWYNIDNSHIGIKRPTVLVEVFIGRVNMSKCLQFTSTATYYKVSIP